MKLAIEVLYELLVSSKSILMSSIRNLESRHRIEAYPRNFVPYVGLSYYIAGDQIVLRTPLSTKREAELAIQLQFMVSLRHSDGPYFKFVLTFDPAQRPFITGPLCYHIFPTAARSFFHRLANAMARVGFLKLEIASIPGAVEAWCIAVFYSFFIVSDSIQYVPPQAYYGFFDFELNTARYISADLL